MGNADDMQNKLQDANAEIELALERGDTKLIKDLNKSQIHK